jgi:hypothetical protein
MSTPNRQRRIHPVAHALAAGALVLAATSAWADTVDQFPVTVDFSSKACATYGDFVSCSAEYLNLLNTGSTSGTTTYNAVTASPQGSVNQFLTLLAGGVGGHDNVPYQNQWGATSLDNPYNPNGQGTLVSYGTQGFYADPNLTNPKPCTDPTPTVPGETTGTCGATTAWDITLSALISVLTFDGTQHEMLLMFDNNQVGSDPSQLINATALVCVHDDNGALGDICFELVDENGTGSPTNIFDPANGPNVATTSFTTSKTYGQLEPEGSNLVVRANGSFCVNANGDVVQLNNAACPAGTTLVNNNLGTNVTEFITTIPELNTQMAALLALGYDRVSFQFMFYNNDDGFEDVYILAGAPLTPPTVPEPATLALLGVALLGIVAVSRRRRKS